MLYFKEPIPLFLRDVFFGEPDVRVRDWLFLDSPAALLFILACYFSVVILGPRWMKERPAWNVKGPMVVYNACQILLSLYMAKEISLTAYQAGYKLSCQPLDTSMDPLALRMAAACWWFFTSKLIDLIDTVFLVVRKKGSQMSFLHIYHHSTMPANWYLGILYQPGGQAWFSCLINSVVHAIMYSYYLLSALGPRVQPYLWWKRYLTQLQMVQFVLAISHVLLGAYHRCDPPNWLTCWTLFYVLTLVALFANFYFKAYDFKVHRHALAMKHRKAPSKLVTLVGQRLPLGVKMCYSKAKSV